jgi:hypothetical protein
MTFLIADTFTDSLARLTGDEQKAVKTTAFDLQMDPSAAGLSFHKLDKAKDKRFWSVRVNTDIRLIVHKTDASIEVLPLQERIENVGDDGDLQEVYDTERQLLYVACTRARDRLSISAVDPASEFLDDVKG